VPEPEEDPPEVWGLGGCAMKIIRSVRNWL
jgi:hypothetical protein